MVPAMGFRHVLLNSSVYSPPSCNALMQGDALKIKKDLNNRFIVDQLDNLADILMRNTVLATVFTQNDMIIFLDCGRRFTLVGKIGQRQWM